MAEQRLIKVHTVVGWPVLKAAAATVKSDVGLYDKLVFQSFVVDWLARTIVAGGRTCPVCGNLWSSREKRDVCYHGHGDPRDDTAATLTHWNAMAEERAADPVFRRQIELGAT